LIVNDVNNNNIIIIKWTIILMADEQMSELCRLIQKMQLVLIKLF